MAPSDADPTARTGVDDTRTAATRIAGLPAHPKDSATPAKTKHQNIHVAPAVLDAARKGDEALLCDLRTCASSPTELKNTCAKLCAAVSRERSLSTPSYQSL